jgi:hypothetical protein
LDQFPATTCMRSQSTYSLDSQTDRLAAPPGHDSCGRRPATRGCRCRLCPRSVAARKSGTARTGCLRLFESESEAMLSARIGCPRGIRTPIC